MTAHLLTATMLGKPGPFQIIESEGCGNVDAPIAAPRRRYECHHYQTCLDLAAALNWDSFTCRGCCQEIDQSLLWRAKQAEKRDSVARSLCEIPELPRHEKRPAVANGVIAESDSTPGRVIELFRSRK